MILCPVQVGDEVSKKSVQSLPSKDVLTVGTEHVRRYGDQHLQDHTCVK